MTDPDLITFIGRFHPVLVHAPIGSLLLLATMEVVGLGRNSLRPSIGLRRVALGFAVVASVAAGTCGWLLGESGNYDPSMLDWHRWLGVGTLGLTVVLVIVASRPRLYAGGLIATLGVLTWTGHNGGNLTHGEGFLTAHAPAGLRSALGLPAIEPAPQSLAEVDVFKHVVQPVLETKCVACHGPSRVEGELRLDSFAAIMAGGKTGATIVSGDAEKSELLRRILLPASDRKHMPPAGRPQPTDDEITLLEWWIETEAPGEGVLLALSPDPVLVEAVAVQLGLPLPEQPDRDAMVAAALALENRLGITVRPLTAEDPWLAASARLAGDAFGDTQLAQLAEIAPALHQLDLGTTAVSDAGLQELAAMTELRRLRLDETEVTDEGLAQLAPLKRLQSLNLHTTGVTDEGMEALTALPRLRQLYLWQTDVTPDAVAALATELEDQRKLARFRSDIDARQRQIAAESFVSDFGATLLEMPAEEADKPDDY